MKNKKVILIIALALIAIIPISFLYSLIVLIIEPSKSFVVENRKNIQSRIYSPDI